MDPRRPKRPRPSFMRLGREALGPPRVHADLLHSDLTLLASCMHLRLRILTSLSCRGILPSLVARGKESGKRPWESQDLGRGLRVSGPRRGIAAATCGKMGRHACSGHGTMRDRARWTPKRRI
ncbi:hypothetical protein CRG98_014610 [Punica granatum]|uniref:Uncharacterized protein n=1 Tax=Punica granatum TaxID=22663 RepID=A0A2I0KB31_PUNGR|nr:hypothetical protein CRG98_014610 [Punica granatum]